MIKLSVCCCTYNRPHLLGELIASFEMQTYPKEYCELIVLDDAGQYGDLRGDNWQIVSFPRRFATLGEKRNACVSLTLPDFTHIVIADDDDIYLPRWLECHAKNFSLGARWSFASRAWWSVDNQITGQWQYQKDDYLMQPAHAFEKSLFWEMGAYPHLAGWEDYQFFQTLLEQGIEHKDSLASDLSPFLIYRRFSEEKHMTCVSVEAYQNEYHPVLPKAELEIGWKRNYLNDIIQHEKEKVES